MNLLDELTIETGDYAFRRTTNPLRKWKNEMFLVNRDFKDSPVLRTKYATGNCYEYVYINKITNLFFSQSQFTQQEKYSTTATAEHIRKVFFEVNDGKDMAECVLKSPIPYDKFSSSETSFFRFSPEIQENIKTDFLQLLNTILIGSLQTDEVEEWAKDENMRYDRALNAEGKDYKIKTQHTRFYRFWTELKCWYFWNGKFYRWAEYDTEGRNSDIPLNPKTGQPFTTKVTYGGCGAEIKGLMEDRNLKAMLMRSIFSPDKHKKSAFYSVRIRRRVKTMDYKNSHISYYDISNAKKFNAKGQASSKGLRANHLYTYHSDYNDHSRGWTFGGISASSMVLFVKQNGYKGKMNYQQSINWILKELD
jgi:hypothetical protein